MIPAGDSPRSTRSGVPGRTGVLLVLGCLLLLSRGGNAASWTDAMGREVLVPDRPSRIVSLVPSVTEILFAVGAGDRVVGVTSHCDYPPEARTRARVGGYADPGIEPIVALSPDVVFAGADAAGPAFVDRLQSLGIPVFAVYPRGIPETAATMRQVAQVAGVPLAGDQLAGRLEEAVRTAAEGVSFDPPPRVLLCVMVRPLVVAGPGTLSDDLIRAAGGVNVVPEGPARYPTWSIESVLDADPDLILVSPHDSEESPQEFFARWPELRAVAAGRVTLIDPDLLQRPGPRLVQGLAALQRALREPGSGGGGP